MPEVQLNFGTMRRYMPAVLKSNTNGWYIEYYAFNQITNGLERKRQRVNKERKRARTFAEFRSITTQMIIRINCQLESGWSPFAISSTLQVQPTMPVVMQPIQLPTQQAMQSYAPEPAPAVAAQQKPVDDGSVDMLVMIRKFLDVKKRDLTENTMRSYESFCNGLKKWIILKHPDLRSNQFTKRLAVEYMDYVLEGNNATKNGKARKHDDGTVSNRTFVRASDWRRTGFAR